MTQRQSFGVLVMQGMIALAVIASVSVLGWAKVLSGEAVTGIIGAVLGLAGGASVAQSASIINGGPKPDWAKLAGTNPELIAQMLSKPTSVAYSSTSSPVATESHTTSEPR